MPTRPVEWGALATETTAQGRLDDAPCIRCGGRIDYNAPPNHPNGPTVDHLVPLGLGGELITDQVGMAHRSCNSSHGAKLGNLLRKNKPNPPTVLPTVTVGEDGGPLVGVGGTLPPGFEAPWLADLLDVPPDATWPRLMTPPHPRAVGSIGWDVIQRAERRRRTDPMVPVKAKSLRWWQKLVLVRMYEVDQDGTLCWPNVVLSTSRQVGKSVLLREVALDRMTQHEYYGEAQLILHMAKDLSIADEIQRPARQWAGIMEDRGEPWHPIGNSGRWAVEYQGVLGRWLIRSQDSVYGFSASTALVDEGWAIDVGPIAEGIEPTMAEREQPQIFLVSTAHTKATPLMPWWRGKAIAQMTEPDDTLLIEWSAPPEAAADKGQLRYHRMASPHWAPYRTKFIGSRVNESGFAEQWLNIWPERSTSVEMMVLDVIWSGLYRPNLMVPTSTSAGHTLALYPNVNQSQWHVMQAGMAQDQAYLRVVGSYPSMKVALEAVGRVAKVAPATLIIPRSVRGRVPRMPGIRAIIQASESDVAAATTTVKPMLSAGRLFHDGSVVLAEQMPKAAVDRYGDTIRITTKGSPVPVEAAKAAVLVVWWASRLDRPQAVVV